MRILLIFTAGHRARLSNFVACDCLIVLLLAIVLTLLRQVLRVPVLLVPHGRHGHGVEGQRPDPGQERPRDGRRAEPGGFQREGAGGD